MDILLVTYKNAKGTLPTIISVLSSALTWGLLTFATVGGALLAYKVVLGGH